MRRREQRAHHYDNLTEWIHTQSGTLQYYIDYDICVIANQSYLLMRSPLSNERVHLMLHALIETKLRASTRTVTATSDRPQIFSPCAIDRLLHTETVQT